MNAIRICVNSFGFDSLSQYCKSMIVWKYGSIIFWIGIIVGSIEYLLNEYMGISLGAYIGFVCLLGVELITGILASVKKGNKIVSRRWDRVIIKLFGYSIILVALWSFGKMEVVGQVFRVVHFIVMGHIIVGLVISIIENIAVMDGKKQTLLVKALKKVLGKYLDI